MPDQIKHGPNKHDNSEDWRSAMFATPDVDLRASPDGSLYLTSRRILSARVRTVVDWLEQWAHDTPASVFISEAMSSGQRQGLSYAKAWHDSGRLGAGLLAIGLKPGDRLAVFAPNGIRHMRIALGALRAGIIYVPIAAQYAALGGDKEKLASVLEKLKPAAVYCDSFADAPLAARAARLVIEGDAGLAQLFEAADGVDDPDIAWLDPSAPAKLLLTSGSTGQPKPVPYSHAMMTDNLLATLDVWPFVLRRKPVLVDWLPWNHAFGGNNNVHIVLSQGGTLHIDESRGKPERFDLHVQNLRRLQPTFHGAVPSGWAALLPVMEADDEFRQAFFGNLDAMFSAGAAMAPDIFTRLCRNSAAVRGLPVPILTGWGATETGPGATLVHAPNAEPGWIGAPLPGAEIRLSPSGDKFELSVRGPSVMRGYWGASASAAVDEEGFYRTGDAGRLVDPERPELGLRFEGRLAEDFKLENGSWVNASGLRHELLRRADGALHDVVILGADQAYIAALCWVARPIRLDDLFAQHNAEHASPTKRIERFAILSPPPSTSELTPKGELDRNALRKNRPFEIEALFNAKGASMIEVDQGKDLAEHVGAELGVSDWVLVDRELIASFGRTTGDTHWVHMDEERARRETPFGGVIAHGFLVLSLVTGLSTQCFRVKRAERWLNYGLDRVRFPATVAADARVRLRLTLVDIGQQAGGTRLQLGCVIEIEGGTRPAAVCDWLCIVFDGDEK